MILARNEGRDYYGEGPEILARRGGPARRSPRPSRSGRTSPSIRLDGHPDFVPTAPRRPDRKTTRHAPHPGTFSFLPDLTDEQITKQIQYACERLGVEHRVHRRPAPPNTYWEMWACRCST